MSSIPNLPAIPSPFLHPPPLTHPSPTPVIVHLRRDQLLPIELNPAKTTPNETLNTRFGHFPHKTLLGIQPGAQVKSSLVGNERNKRRRNGDNAEAGDGEAAGDGPSGFIHILTPTPELWTVSLPHRTQVVYTPDSSYILHRLRAGPGTHIIEAGAGSGSFTHAAVRGVYSGYPDESEGSRGKVFSYEYHATRAEKLRVEVQSHGLDGLVEITHGDVCKDGFRLQSGRDKRKSTTAADSGLADGVERMEVDDEGRNASDDDSEESPEATAVFLDLPAPWLALPHLTRNHQISPTALPIPSLITPTPPPASIGTPVSDTTPPPPTTNQTFTSRTTKGWGSLHPTLPVRICTFSPCIEQIHRTASVLRKLSWTDVEMVEIQHRKLEVRRQKPGGTPGADGAYANVEEAVSKLKGIVDWRRRPFNENGERISRDCNRGDNANSRTKKRKFGDDGDNDANPLVTTRLEPELKTHTSYLLFAMLPPPWTAADEEAAKARVEADKGRFLVTREKDGVSTWKKEKEKKKGGKYGVLPGSEDSGLGATKTMTRKERKRLERAEKYGKGSEGQRAEKEEEKEEGKMKGEEGEEGDSEAIRKDAMEVS